MARAGQRTRLVLSCGCSVEWVMDDEMPPWEIGEATFCDIDAHEMPEVVEVFGG